METRNRQNQEWKSDLSQKSVQTARVICEGNRLYKG